MITFWQRMGDLYGHRWSSAYGQPTVAATDDRGQLQYDGDGHSVERLNPTLVSWQRVLRGITPAELKYGLQACAMRGEEWPPSAPQFRERCRPHREPYEREEFQGNALPQLPADREFALDAIAKLRGRMGASYG